MSYSPWGHRESDMTERHSAIYIFVIYIEYIKHILICNMHIIKIYTTNSCITHILNGNPKSKEHIHWFTSWQW